ncbi:hypothetical protein ACODT5_15485 [Streptomyces sp. 5.8]
MTEPCEPTHWPHPYAVPPPEDDERDIVTAGAIDDYQPEGNRP